MSAPYAVEKLAFPHPRKPGDRGSWIHWEDYAHESSARREARRIASELCAARVTCEGELVATYEALPGAVYQHRADDRAI